MTRIQFEVSCRPHSYDSTISISIASLLCSKSSRTRCNPNEQIELPADVSGPGWEEKANRGDSDVKIQTDSVELTRSAGSKRFADGGFHPLEAWRQGTAHGRRRTKEITCSANAIETIDDGVKYNNPRHSPVDLGTKQVSVWLQPKNWGCFVWLEKKHKDPPK